MPACKFLGEIFRPPKFLSLEYLDKYPNTSNCVNLHKMPLLDPQTIWLNRNRVFYLWVPLKKIAESTQLLARIPWRLLFQSSTQSRSHHVVCMLVVCFRARANLPEMLMVGIHYFLSRCVNNASISSIFLAFTTGTRYTNLESIS